MSGLWSSAPVGGLGGIRPPGPAVGKSGSTGDRRKKKELFRKALKKSKGEPGEPDGADPSVEASSGDPGTSRKESAGTGGGGEESGHKVDVLA